MPLKAVLPYHHTNKLFVKGRWLGRTILDVVVDEFKTRDRAFHLQQIHQHRIQIIRNGVPITGDSLLSLQLQNKDVLQITLHKHEPPVLDCPIHIIHDSQELLVVNKPPSIPVHPTGRYFFNSLTEILRPKFNDLFLCHRLDRLTSGIVILTKTPQLASTIQAQIRGKSVRKQYLARVSGEFPKTSLQCDEPVGNIDTKLGFQNGIKQRKDASTVFTRLKYNKTLNESIVLCQPLTGRTHQIRIHLLGLGHPIVNDPLYGPTASSLRTSMISSTEPITEDRFNELLQEDKQNIKDLQSTGECGECGELQFMDQNPDDMILWLHAYRYKFQDFDLDFETSHPDWCDI